MASGGVSLNPLIDPNRDAQARLDAAKQKQAEDAERNSASLLKQQQMRAQQSLRPIGQQIDPAGRVSTQYGSPSSVGLRGASSSTSGSGDKEGISESEFLRIKSLTGAGQQPTISRGNVAGEQQARDAAFARAKEKSGQIAQSSLEGLRNSLSRRGITGGGYANMRAAESLAPATDQLQDFNREQLIQDLGQSRHVADTEYQGQIAQRGQNQASINALLSLINSRGKLY